MSTWPSSLPATPLLQRFRRQSVDNKQEFQPEGGRSKSLVFYTNVPETFRVRFFLEDNTQRETLETFYRTTTNFGTQRFTFTDPQSGNSVTARFLSRPEYTTIDGTKLHADFELEIDP